VYHHCQTTQQQQLQSGTLLTANGGAWNAISGSFKDNSGQGVTLRIQNIQAGNDIYIDDISAMRCSVEDFRYVLHL
jgi:hypothetical protein